ncbi:MAG: hypothetical protein Q8N55_03395 [bacterium]|nr:hypothetical protein [bacterium]
MKSKSSIKQVFQILISVDEQKLRLQREESDIHFSLEEVIQNEFGWLYESGIHLDKICKHK